jgi:tetraacyldisaccharide 4'-kinase
VGNLSVGGTGKTPMIEYLIRILRRDHLVATLSRGYKRKTKGFTLANKNSTVEDLGDEPYQFKYKFNDILVAVDGNRQNAIQNLLVLNNPPEIILLDDGFQHRKVKAGLYILLTTYNKLYINDLVLPTGDLREPRSGAKRADVIIVTKCPTNMSKEDKSEIIKKLKPKPNQNIFFSYIKYDSKVYNENKSLEFDKLSSEPFTLVTGIENSMPLVEFLLSRDLKFEHLNFNDHYNFTQKDIDYLKSKKMILTTEKDFMRLKDKLEASNIFYLPIKTEIDKEEEFNNFVEKFLPRF